MMSRCATAAETERSGTENPAVTTGAMIRRDHRDHTATTADCASATN